MSHVDWLWEFRHLWERMVPASGQADTVQGELIRCVGKVSDEAYRNGNINWGPGYERLIRFVVETLDDPETFTAEQRREIRNSAEAIVVNADSPDLSGRGSPYYHLTEMAVRWCQAHPEPLPREADPTLEV